MFLFKLVERRISFQSLKTLKRSFELFRFERTIKSMTYCSDNVAAWNPDGKLGFKLLANRALLRALC